MDMPTHEKRNRLRTELWNMMHNGSERAGQVFNFCLVVLILLSVAMQPLLYVVDYPFFTRMINDMEAVIIALFTVEYLLRIYAAPHRLRYIFSFFGVVDFLSIVPFYSGIFRSEWIHAFRLIRFLKIGEIQAGAAADSEEVLGKSVGLIDGEYVEYIVTKHPLFLFLNCIPPAIAISSGLGIILVTEGHLIGIALGLSLLMFAFLFLLKAWLDFSYDVIYLTNFRLIFHNQHLFGRSINQMHYSAITNVKPSYTSILSFVFRYGSLDIETPAESTGHVSIGMIRKHEQAAHLIMQKSFAKQETRDQRTPEAEGRNDNGSTAAPSL